MSPSLAIFSRAAIAPLLTALLVSTQTDAACENIVATRHAEYMVLDPEMLTTLQVGNLHWLGIYSAFPRVGSSLERALVSVSPSYFIHTNSEEPVFEQARNSTYYTSALMYLENLGKDLRSQGEIPVMRHSFPRVSDYSVLWADWIEEDTVIREDYYSGQQYVSYELLDTDFNVLRRWVPGISFNLGYPSCAIDDKVYFAGRNEVRVFDDQGGSIFELESLQRENLRLVPFHTKNCKALAFRDTPHDNPMFGAVLIDVVEGTLGPEFSVGKFNNFLLYDEGRRLLQQRREASIVTESSGFTYMTRDHDAPVDQFSLIDTTTGEVLLEKTLEIGSGLLSGEMLCDEETPRALVQDDDAFYLIDPNTLEIVASKAVPTLWGSIYYVFE